MTSNFSEEFNRLADRFATITADNSEDGERYLRNTSAAAFTTLGEAVKAGALTLVDKAGAVTVLDIAEPTADESDIERLEMQCALAWYAFCVNFGRKHRIRNPSLFRKAGDGFLAKAKDWQQRGHNFAMICRSLGEMCVAAEPATGKSDGATATEEDDSDDLLDEVCDGLRSPDHRCIVQKLWKRRRSTDWQDLAEECGTSSNYAAVKKALQRLDEALTPFAARGVYLDNNQGTKRVKLIHPQETD